MLTSPRPPCVRRNAPPALSSSSSPRRRPLLRLNSAAPPPYSGNRQRHSGQLIARTRAQCSKWEEYEDEEDMDLETEILEFMRVSSKPEAFPSRRELEEAGRGDLAEAIVEKGGWLSLGWDLEEEEEAHHDIIANVNVVDEDEDYNENFERISRAWNNDNDDGNEDSNYNYSGGAKSDDQEASSILSLYPYDNPINAEEEEETGIEGILSRLEKQRSDSFGFGEVENEDEEEDVHTHSKFPTHTTVTGFFRISRSSSSNDNSNHNKPFPNNDVNIDPKIWRSWTNQRPGVSEIDIEEPSEVITKDETLVEKEKANDDEQREQNYFESRREDITHNQLRSRLQNLELELSSVLRSVRSSGDEIASQKDLDGFSNDLQKIYDTWEFQENEIMRAQDKLRSTRAKLAVLEGKMTLAIIEAQKIMEEKQKRIDDARRALRLLYSTCIVWPNPASEVLLAGSFDGWATLRKMEKSSTGIFSLWLQLYPGKYEIKFIVDGEWRVDPQRSTTNNNGHLNNLLIIS